MKLKTMSKQTAIDWLVGEFTNLGYLIAPSFGHSIIDEKIKQAKKMEQEQMGYTKEDVLKAGEIGEINHYDYKHIVKLLDEAREINRKEIKLKQ